MQLDVIYCPPPPGEGFGEHLPFEHPNVRWLQVENESPFGKQFGMYQKGVLGYLIKTRPDAILIWANPRYLSFWGVLILGRMLSIPVYPRGHGLFKKKRVSIFYKMMYKLILTLSHKYVCYTPNVKASLLPLVKREERLAVDYNTLHNAHPITPDVKTGQEKGIFYIGRVRPGCGVDVLIQAVEHLNQQEGLDIELQVIGDGPMGDYLREKALQFSWVKYHGKVFDQKKISDISSQCRIGCVPGFMGLNAVHMMSLSLPVVTHAKLDQHMGPEPEYIQHKVNGWLIENPNNTASLVETLRELWQMPVDKFKLMQENAYKTYGDLSRPSYHERLMHILEV
jgi:glycosyltransferase involved in cell wall biosynthesis